jgi:hypothetical protein
MMLTTESLADATRELLQSSLPSSFRYYRSFTHFRRKLSGGLSYLTINTETHDRATYHLAFYLGVRHDEVEARIRRILQLDPKLNHYARTIWCYTVNIGPGSPHWDYPIRGSWDFTDLVGLSQAAGEISEFVAELAVPYLRDHEDLSAVRRTLMESPGRAQNPEPYRQILMIDRILGDDAQSVQDLCALESRYAGFHEGFRREFEAFRDSFFSGDSGGV